MPILPSISVRSSAIIHLPQKRNPESRENLGLAVMPGRACLPSNEDMQRLKEASFCKVIAGEKWTA